MPDSTPDTTASEADATRQVLPLGAESGASRRPLEGPWGFVNWREFLAGAPEIETSECELFSDAHFTGHLYDAGSPYQVLNMIAMDDGQARAALTLRMGMHIGRDVVTEQISAMQRTENAATDRSRFHGGDLRDEVAALLSLALGVRVQAGEFTREFHPGGDPRGLPVAYERRPSRPFLRSDRRYVVPGVVGTRALETDLLAMYPALPADQATVLLRSARSYQEALWICEIDPNLAWLLLVSALETAANQWFPVEGKGAELAPLPLLESFKPALVAQLRAAGGEEIAETVAKEFVGLFKATDKFLRFVLRFMPPAPEPRPPEWVALGWSKTKMRAALDKIYELRSYGLHGAVPFLPPMCEPPFPLGAPGSGTQGVAEIPYYTLSYQQGGFWTAEETPMLLNTFEYLARSALQAWWRWLGGRVLAAVGAEGTGQGAPP